MLRPMTFWERVAASVIDGLYDFLLITLPFATYFYSSYEKLPLSATLILAAFSFFLIIFLWTKFGATPGKMHFGAKIVDADTLGPPTRKQLVIRYFAYTLSIFSFFLGFLVAAFNKKGQTLHDYLSNTMVVIEDNKIFFTPHTET